MTQPGQATQPTSMPTTGPEANNQFSTGGNTMGQAFSPMNTGMNPSLFSWLPPFMFNRMFGGMNFPNMINPADQMQLQSTYGPGTYMAQMMDVNGDGMTENVHLRTQSDGTTTYVVDRMLNMTTSPDSQSPADKELADALAAANGTYPHQATLEGKSVTILGVTEPTMTGGARIVHLEYAAPNANAGTTVPGTNLLSVGSAEIDQNDGADQVYVAQADGEGVAKGDILVPAPDAGSPDVYDLNNDGVDDNAVTINGTRYYKVGSTATDDHQRLYDMAPGTYVPMPAQDLDGDGVVDKTYLRIGTDGSRSMVGDIKFAAENASTDEQKIADAIAAGEFPADITLSDGEKAIILGGSTREVGGIKIYEAVIERPEA